MKKVLMVYDQIQSGMGTKDDAMLALGAKREVVGPAVMMSKYLNEIDAKVVGCVYCGSRYFFDKEEEVTRKIIALINKMNPDVVVCGPAFDYEEYSVMCARLCEAIQTNTNVKAIAAFNCENEKLYNAYRNSITIIKTPKKGGLGLDDSLKELVCCIDRI